MFHCLDCFIVPVIEKAHYITLGTGIVKRTLDFQNVFEVPKCRHYFAIKDKKKNMQTAQSLLGFVSCANNQNTVKMVIVIQADEQRDT